MTTKGIKNNYIGKIIEDSAPFWQTQAKSDDPRHVNERAYEALTRDLLTNEIFRRVEKHGRTMVEYLN